MDQRVHLGDEFAEVFASKMSKFTEIAEQKVGVLRLHFEDAAKSFQVGAFKRQS